MKSRDSSMKNENVIRTPIHIYVLWHPQFAPGKDLAGDIYRWFRLDNIEGIPVFFRSTNAKPDPESKPDAAAASHPPDIQSGADINYVIPLVDAHMVADPAWRQWLVTLHEDSRDSVTMAKAKDGAEGKPSKQRLFPVAVDSYAFQAPAELRDLNFIRHDITRQPTLDVDVLLSVLTEVMCRDLRYHLHRKEVQRKEAKSKEAKAAHDDGGHKAAGGAEPGGLPSKIKIFLSHAKADGTDVVRRLKEHIQSQTQCETFFDETDIPSGHGFSEVLDQAIAADSAGMIVIHGSQYAERPWCRREIRRFQEPRPDPHDKDEPVHGFFVPPVVVVENLNGDRVSRSIPELGFAPSLRWSAGAERRIVNTLLREVLFGFFHRLLIHNAAKSPKANSGDIMVNRSPDPLMVQRLIVALDRERQKNAKTAPGQQPMPFAGRVYYPGYGLSQVELAAMEAAFGRDRFKTLSDLGGPQEPTATDPAPPGGRGKGLLNPLAGRVVRLSVGDSTDILDGGYGDEHNRELILRLFRPLARAGVSILYGGMMPDAAGALLAWEKHPKTGERFVNFTSTCVHVLIAERDHSEDGTGVNSNVADRGLPAPDARLFSMPVWPESKKVTAELIAKWVDVCTFRPVTPDDLAMPSARTSEGNLSAFTPEEGPKELAPVRTDFDSIAEWKTAVTEHEEKVKRAEEHNAVLAACCLTQMRRTVCGTVSFPNLNLRDGDEKSVTVRPMAHVFLGGKLKGWNGIAPGIYEEFAAAVTAKVKQPIFLIGAGQGAAGAIARWLMRAEDGPSTPDVAPLERPPEFQEKACQATAKNKDWATTFAERKDKGSLPEDQWDLREILDAIENAVAKVRVRKPAKPDLGALLNNGLSHEENLQLLRPNTSHGTICKLIHQGLVELASPGSAKRPPGTASPGGP